MGKGLNAPTADFRGPENRGLGAVAARVLIIDEHVILRELLASFIDRHDQFSVVGAVGSEEEALTIVRSGTASIGLVTSCSDLTMTVELVRQLMGASPGFRCLVLGRDMTASFIQSAVVAGATGFIDKGSDLATLVLGLEAVRDGREFFGGNVPEVIRTIVMRRTFRRSSDELTKREREVLTHLAKGLIYKEVASELALSVFAVENLRRRITRKTGLRSIAELTLHAVELGLVPMPVSEFRTTTAV